MKKPILRPPSPLPPSTPPSTTTPVSDITGWGGDKEYNINTKRGGAEEGREEGYINNIYMHIYIGVRSRGKGGV